MATAEPGRSPPLNFIAFAIAVSATLATLFVLCWLFAALLPEMASASHGWIALFSTAPVSSGRALAEGLLWSVVFGWIIAAVLVPIYNRIAKG